jgi:hypothetical protein
MILQDAFSRIAPHRDGAVSRGRRVTGYLLIVVVMGAVAAMSWSGLYGFARDTMHWTPAHAALVPVSLDIAALACAALALDSVSRNDPAAGYRILTAALVALSAFVNWRHALASHNIAEQVFFPAMSILSYWLIHLTLGKYRRDARRDRAGMPAREALAPLPRTGLAVWLPGLGHPGRAFAAIRTALANRLPATDAGTEAQRERDRAAGFIAGLTQADAIRHALATVGADNPRAVADYLADHGRAVPTSRVYDVLRRDGLRAVGDGGAGEPEAS